MRLLKKRLLTLVLCALLVLSLVANVSASGLDCAVSNVISPSQVTVNSDGSFYIPTNLLTNGWNTITTPYSTSTCNVSGNAYGETLSATTRYSYAFRVSLYVQNDIVTDYRSTTFLISPSITVTPMNIGTAAPQNISTSCQILSSGSGVLLTASFQMVVHGYSELGGPYDLYGNAYCSKVSYI